MTLSLLNLRPWLRRGKVSGKMIPIMQMWTKNKKSSLFRPVLVLLCAILCAPIYAQDLDIETLTPVEDATAPNSPILKNWQMHQRKSVSFQDLEDTADTSLIVKPALQPIQEIILWHGFRGEVSKKFGELVEEFNQQQEKQGIPYRIQPVEKGSYEDVITAFRDASLQERPDILQAYEMATRLMRELRNSEDMPLYIPLHDLLKQAGIPDINEDEFVPAVREFYRAGERELSSLPFNTSTVVLYYNKTALDKARAKPLRYWEEFLPQMALLKLNAAPIGLGAGWLAGHHIDQVGARHNKRIATQDNGVAGRVSSLNLDAFFEKHLKNLKDWYKQGVFSSQEGADAEKEFAEGKIVYLSQGANGFANIEKAVDKRFEIGVAPFPYWRTVVKSPYNTIAGGASLWVVRKNYTPERLKSIGAFLKFLQNRDTQAKWQRLSGYVPVTEGAHAQNVRAGFFDSPELGPRAAQIAHDTLTLPNRGHFSRGILLDRFPDIRRIETEEMKAVIQGKRAASEAIRIIERRGNQILQDARREVKREPERNS